MKTSLLGCWLVAGCCLLRSTDLFFRVHVVTLLSVPVIIFWEHIFNSIAVLPLFWRQRREIRKVNATDFFLFVMVGAGASAMGVLCFTQAFHYMNPALAILLQKLQPLITISLSVVFLRERLFPGFFRWALPAIAASYFVSFSTTNPFSGSWEKTLYGTFYAVMAAFFWGSGTIWGKLLLRKFHRNFLLGGRFLVGAVFLGALLLWFEIDPTNAGTLWRDYPLLGRMMYMALVSGLVATSLFYLGLQWVDAALTSILELIFPISSVFIMWFFFSQPLDWVQLTAGAALIVSILRITHGQEATTSNSSNPKQPTPGPSEASVP